MHLSKGPLVLVSLIDKFRNCVFHHRDIQSDVGHAGLVHDNTHRHNNSCQGQWRRFEHCVPPRKNILQRSAWHRQSRAQCGVERVRGNVRWRVVWLLESSACETLISANNTTTVCDVCDHRLTGVYRIRLEDTVNWYRRTTHVLHLKMNKIILKCRFENTA